MNNIEEIYRNQFSTFELFTRRLEQLFETILKNSNVRYHLVESRTKSIESFCEKINRKKDKYTFPLKEVTDICALRIIVYYIDDLEIVEKLLRENFNIDENNSYHAKNNMTDNEFGYLSSHFVISLKSNRSKLLEWQPYKDFKAEIQIRTVLQHAWAAISHELEYKKKYEIPSVLKRKLFRLAGLIELADEEFQEAKEKHHAVELAIRNDTSIFNQQVNEELNLNTLKNYLSKNIGFISKFDELAKKVGFDVENWNFAISETNSYISDIIKICEVKQISTIEEFDYYLQEIYNTAETRLEKLLKVDGDNGWTVSTEFIILLLIIVSLNEKQLIKYGNSIWSNSVWSLFMEFAFENSYPN